MSPRRLQKVQEAAQSSGSVQRSPRGAAGSAPRALFETMLRDPALRDPRGYVLPADQARRTAAHLPHARVVVVPDAGHMPFWEAPQRFFPPVLAFLDDAA